MWLFFMLLIAVCIGIGLAVSDEKKEKAGFRIEEALCFVAEFIFIDKSKQRSS